MVLEPEAEPSELRGGPSACGGRRAEREREEEQLEEQAGHSGGRVAVPSEIAPRDVSARARRPGLIEPRGQRLRRALLVVAGARPPLFARQWGMAQAASLLVRMVWGCACWVSFSRATQGSSRSEAWSSLPWATQAGEMASATAGVPGPSCASCPAGTAGQDREREREREGRELSAWPPRAVVRVDVRGASTPVSSPSKCGGCCSRGWRGW
jgi:hypothetical protein